jgi:hypothetical protein
LNLELDTESGEIRRPNGQPLPHLRLKANDMLPTVVSARPEVPLGATVSVWLAPRGSRVGVEGGSGDLDAAFICTIPDAGEYIMTVSVSWASYRITSRDIRTTIEPELITDTD